MLGARRSLLAFHLTIERELADSDSKRTSSQAFRWFELDGVTGMVSAWA